MKPSKRRYQGQVILRTNADWHATLEAGLGLPDVKILDPTEKGLIPIYFKSLGTSAQLSSKGKIQLSYTSWEDLERVKRLLKAVLVPRKGEELFLEEERRIPLAGSLESLISTSMDYSSGFLQSLEDEDSRFLLKGLIKKYEKGETNSEVMKQISRLVKGLVLFCSSPEFVTWIKSKKSEVRIHEFEKLIEAVDKTLVESNVEFKDDAERLEYALKVMRELIVSELMTMRAHEG